ncbi:MAG: ATP-grasp domain-containing protein [Solirubrobacteraceae bacterium]
MRALIVDQCGNRAALPAARALESDGWTVGVGSARAQQLAGQSRAVSRAHRLPPASTGGAALLSAVNRAIAECGYEVVFSLDDVGVLALSAHRDELDAVFPYGEHRGLERAFDKLELMREAHRAGLTVPRTELAGELELESFGDARPVVVKPRLTFLPGVDGHVRATVVSSSTTAREKVQAMREAGAEPILQEHLQGQLMAFTALTDRDAQIVARVQQVSDRIWPLDVGISACAHTVAVDERLAASAARLLEALGWFGLAQLQFIRGRDGTARLLDFNGRFYGSLALALAAGVNLPAIWGRMAAGRPIVEPAPEARVGVRYQWLGGDLRASCAGASGFARVRGVLGSILHAPGSTHSIWRMTDPWPAIAILRTRISAWLLRRA